MTVIFYLLKRIDRFAHKLARKLQNVDRPTDGLWLRDKVIERAFVLSRLRDDKGKVLDVGCAAEENCVPVALALLGYEAFGIDIRDFRVKIHNFHFVRGDIRNSCFLDNCFDYICAISTIEHIGVGTIYGSNIEPDGDRKAMNEIWRLLRPEGHVFLSVPFGQATVVPGFQRIYDRSGLHSLTEFFLVEEMWFFGRAKDGWFQEIPEEQACQYTEKSPQKHAIAVMILRKDALSLKPSAEKRKWK